MTEQNAGREKDSGFQERVLGKERTELVLGYIMCPLDAGKSFLGALLITDWRTTPLHFAYVTPVRPSVMQRFLYGSRLNEHVKVDVICTELLRNLPRQPDVVFVDSKDLLTARRVTKRPTAYIEKNLQAGGEPVGFVTIRFDAGPEPKDQDAVGQVLSALEREVDLFDPFSRIREAIKEALKAPGA